MFDMFRKSLKVIREKEGKHVAGYWRGGEKEEFTIKASVQATGAEILQTLPEGKHSSLSYTLITDTKLQTVNVGSTVPDIVIIDDERFLVERVTAWQNLTELAHYEIVVSRENKDKITGLVQDEN